MKPRWLYWALFLAIASQGRFISLVMSDSLRFSDFQVGLVLGVGIIASMLSLPVASRRADAAGCLPVQKKLVAGHMATFSLLGLVGLVNNDTLRVVLAIATRFLAFAFIAPTGSILDAYTLKVIDDKNLYGKERLWGAVSWAVASILMGIAMDTFDSPLYISIAFCVIGTLMFFGFVRHMPDERAISNTIQAQPVGETVPRSPPLLTIWRGRPTVAVFFYVALVMGAATSIVENLLFLFMREDLKASYTLCGISVVITVVFEIPLFFVGHRLLSNVGVLKLLLIGIFCYVSRVICYTLISEPWTVLLVEPFHGLTYASIQTASVAFVHRHCPEDRTAEGQGMYTLVRSVGQLLGTTIGSWVLQTFGSKVMYRVSAAFATTAAIALFLVFKWYEQADIEHVEVTLSTYRESHLESSAPILPSVAILPESDIEMPVATKVDYVDYKAMPRDDSGEDTTLTGELIGT